jgi:hypothetical protein
MAGYFLCQQWSHAPGSVFRISGWWLAVASFWLQIGVVAWAQGYTPEHPRVRAMVDKGIAYLIQDKEKFEEYGGGKEVLIAYTILKVTGDVDQPKVKAGISTALKIIGSSRGEPNEKIVYSAAMAGILLAEVDPEKYRSELQILIDWFVEVQKPHGGFSYLNYTTGDTSQVQYAMLCLWTLHSLGMSVPQSTVEKTIDYLKNTQDPSGGWGYQGKLADGQLVQQDRVNKSLSTAGAGSLLIAGDMLGLFRIARRSSDEAGIPPAFIRMDTIIKKREAGSTIKRSDLDDTVNRMVNFHKTHQWTSEMFYYYWRYSEERYESFLDVTEGRTLKSPDWYNRGVEQLAKLQSPNGAWTQASMSDFTSDEICTSFAVLYLIRSTQRAIIKLKEGVLGGGYGLPDDLTAIKRMGDRIVNEAETTVDNLLALLEKESTDGVEISLLPKDLQLSKDPSVRKDQVARLARLLVSDDHKSRRIAAKLLGRSEDLQQAPELIYALRDSDPHVPAIAEESLRLLSRKLKSGNLTIDPTLEQKKQAQQFWKEWFLGLRPDFIFLQQ